MKGRGRLRSQENGWKSGQSERSKWRELVRNEHSNKKYLGFLKGDNKRLERKKGLACLGL